MIVIRMFIYMCLPSAAATGSPRNMQLTDKHYIVPAISLRGSRTVTPERTTSIV
jgi:hypothetical protein